MRHALLALLSLSIFETSAHSAPDWSAFLTRKEVGAAAWSKAHPTWDGRGVVIAVLDTGVDATIPGLDRLPDGAPKVIEARDFTGQGDVALERITPAADGTLTHSDLTLRGLGALPLRLPSSPLWFGFFNESTLANGAVEDIDGDGRTDGRFAILALRRAPDGEQVAIIDTDHDGDLSDELVRRSYDLEPTPFVLGAAPKRRIALSLTIDLDEKKVSLHFDHGSHGSHCAGIAAGYRIEGRDGFDGIAPNARIMSLKIGHGTLSGGATTKGSMLSAIRFASDWAASRKTPVVISMSYGIGSETEGASDIDKALDAELEKNRYLIAAVSASNDGPGLSNIGTPAAANLAFATAAMLTPELGATLRGAKLRKSSIFAFSSRGGELAKPDGLAPGVAWSAVPATDDSAIMNGTSMAAPQAAGVIALLYSASLESRLAVTPAMVRRALKHSARPLPGYTSLDQGPGLINVGGAWEALLKLAKSSPSVAGWRVETAIPGRPGERGSSSYWRVGARPYGLGAALGEMTDTPERVTFTITPIFFGDVTDADRARHFDRISLSSDSAWLTLSRKDLGLRGDTPTKIDADLRLDALAEPGLYIANIRATENGTYAFDLPVVVIVPHAFRDRWTQRFEGRVEAADVQRIFVEPPPGATHLHAVVSIIKGNGTALLSAFDPAGRAQDPWQRASSRDLSTAEFTRSGTALDPGTWELDVIGALDSGPISYALDVTFSAFDLPSEVDLQTNPAGTTEGSLRIVNRMDQPFRGRLSATLPGYERKKRLEATTDILTFPIEVGPTTDGVDLTLELAPEVWARMTDVAVTITNADGHAVVQDAFGQRVCHTRLEGSPGRYTATIRAGFANPSESRPWSVHVNELHLHKSPPTLSANSPENSGFISLYPGAPVTLSLSGTSLPALPTGFQHRLKLELATPNDAPWGTFQLPTILEP